MTLVISLGKENVKVPDVTRRTVSKATDVLKEAQLTVADEIDERYSNDIPEGSVIATSPRANEMAERDSAVSLIVSLGPEPQPVPTVVSLDEAAAVAAVKQQGFAPEVTKVHHDSVPEGRVIDQKPGTGERKVPGSTIEIIVSLGPELITVPNLQGQNIEEGVAALEKLGFQVVREPYLGGIFSTIHSTDPEGGTLARKGSTVTIRYV